MKKRNRRSRLSLGTAFMLLFTVLVVLGCAGFLLMITGESAYSTADIQIRFAQETPVPENWRARSVAAAPSAAPKTRTLTQIEATQEPAAQKTTITIAAAGTVHAPKAVRQTAETGADKYDFEPVFAGLSDVFGGADLAIATLEGTTAGRDKGYGSYNAPAQILDALRACGVDLLSLATERALDKGYDGLEITLQEMTSRGLIHAGVYPDGAQQRRAVVGSIGGVQVAVLAYTYGMSDEGEEKTGADAKQMLPRMDEAQVRSDIAAARASGANLVIVLPHWGTKNKQATPESVKATANMLAQAGADLVLGTHPNVAQGVERIAATRADGLTYETLVCYSLGSLLTDARTEENTASMAVAVDVTYDPATRRIAIGEERITPLYIARTREAEETVYRVLDAGDESAVAALEASEQLAAARAKEIVQQMTEEKL